MWRYRVATVRELAEPGETDEAESLSLAKFADADEDAPPLDRPHAPNCMNLRKLLRKGSSEERYADLSFSNDDDSSLRRSPLYDNDTKDTVHNAALLKPLKGFRMAKSCVGQHDSMYDRNIDEAIQPREPQKGLETKGRDRCEQYGLVHRKRTNPHRPIVSNGDKVDVDMGIALKAMSESDNWNSAFKAKHGVEARVIPADNLFVRAYHFIQLVFATLCQVLKNLTTLPVRLWRVGRKELSNVKENSQNRTSYSSSEKCNSIMNSVNERCSEKREFDLTKKVQGGSTVDHEVSKSRERSSIKTHVDITMATEDRNIHDHELKSSEGPSGEGHSDRNRITEGGKSIERSGSNSSSASKTMFGGIVTNVDMYGKRTKHYMPRTSSQVVHDDSYDSERKSFKNTGDNSSEDEIADQHGGKQELPVRFDHPMKARETLSEGTSAEENDGDAWLWHKIENSDKWMGASERNLHHGSAVKEMPSPLRLETPRHLQCGTHHTSMDSSNEYSLFSPEPEARRNVQNETPKISVADEIDDNERHVLVDGELISPKGHRIRYKDSNEQSQLPVRNIEQQHQRSIERRTKMPMALRMTSTNSETHVFAENDDPSNAQGPHLSPARGSGVSTPRRKAFIGTGIKSDVKAVTESVKRVFMRNKPEPDTRFTSPRSAQKTLTIIADVMVKELACMVAVRRTGALKLRSEKVYSPDARLRTSLRFRALDEFSCNVIISRARDDDFTVTTADYVNFVAGLQQRFLNSVTGAWRYQ